tara:strand:- start:291 stop:539 length:249 start_codon:yes stop_codon:yes gene_type:complete
LLKNNKKGNKMNKIIKINLDRELMFNDIENQNDVDTVIHKKILGENFSNSQIMWDPISPYTLEEIDDEQYLVFEIRYEQEDF